MENGSAYGFSFRLASGGKIIWNCVGIELGEIRNFKLFCDTLDKRNLDSFRLQDFNAKELPSISQVDKDSGSFFLGSRYSTLGNFNVGCPRLGIKADQKIPVPFQSESKHLSSSPALARQYREQRRVKQFESLNAVQRIHSRRG